MHAVGAGGTIAGAALVAYLLGRRSPGLGAAWVFLTLTAALSSFEALKHLGMNARWGALAGLGLVVASTLATRSARRAIVIIAAVGALLLTSVTWSIDPMLTFQRAIAYTLVVGVTYGLTLSVASHDARQRSLMLRLAFAAALVTVLTLVVLATGADQAVMHGADSGLVRGITESSNTFGELVALAIPLWLAALDRRGRGWTLGSLAVLGGSEVLILLSGSRTGVIIAALATLAYLVARRRGQMVTLAAIVSAVVVLGYWEVGRTTSLIPQAARLGSVRQGIDAGDPPVASANRTSRWNAFLSGRDEAWQASWDLFVERPVLGYGFGSGDRVFERHGIRFPTFVGNDPNNGYIRAVLELGVLGGAAFLSVLVGALAVALASLRRGPHAPGDATAVALLIAICIGALTETFIVAPGTPWAFLFWIAVWTVLLPALRTPRLLQARPTAEAIT